jgi:protein gp37
MSDDIETAGTEIPWTDTAWNPLAGCTRKSAACRHCYAETATAESALAGGWGQGHVETGEGGAAWTGTITLREDRLSLPLDLKDPCRIFVNSLSDLFHESLPEATIDRIFAIMAGAPHHIFQVLTKRPKTMQPYIADPATPGRIAGLVAGLGIGAGISSWPLPNVWLGVTAENQKEADRRIPLLLETPAVLRWVAAEPLLEAIDLKPGTWLKADTNHRLEPGAKLDWVVAGGEISAEAKPCHPDWARSLRDQCLGAKTPFFWTRWGEHVPVTGVEEKPASEPDKMTWERIGTRPARRSLDGVLHDAVPRLPN